MAFTDWINLASSHLNATRFDTDTGVLDIRYSSGLVYEWFCVTPDVFSGLTEADSPGKYAREFVEGVYGKGKKVI